MSISILQLQIAVLLYEMHWLPVHSRIIYKFSLQHVRSTHQQSACVFAHTLPAGVILLLRII